MFVFVIQELLDATLFIGGHAAVAVVLVLDVVWDSSMFSRPNLDLKSGQCRHPHRCQGFIITFCVRVRWERYSLGRAGTY